MKERRNATTNIKTNIWMFRKKFRLKHNLCARLEIAEHFFLHMIHVIDRHINKDININTFHDKTAMIVVSLSKPLVTTKRGKRRGQTQIQREKK